MHYHKARERIFHTPPKSHSIFSTLIIAHFYFNTLIFFNILCVICTQPTPDTVAFLNPAATKGLDITTFLIAQLLKTHNFSFYKIICFLSLISFSNNSQSIESSAHASRLGFFCLVVSISLDILLCCLFGCATARNPRLQTQKK